MAVLDGTAESLPLPTASADAACAGQAFHWFDVDRAMAEIARVLRSRGVLIAGWNLPPDDGTWYDAVVEYLRVANPDHLPSRTQDWAAVFGGQPGFTGLLEISARHDQAIDRAAFRRLLGTHSAINVLPAERRTRAARPGHRRRRCARRLRRRGPRGDRLALRLFALQRSSYTVPVTETALPIWQ